jgi:hypothetical protein
MRQVWGPNCPNLFGGAHVTEIRETKIQPVDLHDRVNTNYTNTIRLPYTKVAYN